MADFINIYFGSFMSLHSTMPIYRRQNQPVTPQSITKFHLQLAEDCANVFLINNEPELFVQLQMKKTLCFGLPGVKKYINKYNKMYFR